MSRPNTPDEVLPDGTKRIRVKRCRNGCGRSLGDVREAEIVAVMVGGQLPDVREECGCLRAREGDLCLDCGQALILTDHNGDLACRCGWKPARP